MLDKILLFVNGTYYDCHFVWRDELGAISFIINFEFRQIALKKATPL